MRQPRLSGHPGVATRECRLQRAQGERAALAEGLGDLLGAHDRISGDLVDQAHVERLLRRVLAVEVPHLLGATAADRLFEVPRAVAGVEAPDHGADLPEDGVGRGDREVAHDVEHVAAAHREAVDRGDDRLRHRVDELVEIDDGHHARVVQSGELVVLTADAEELVAGTGQDGHVDGGSLAHVPQRLEKLARGLESKLVRVLRAVDRDRRHTVLDRDDDVFVGHVANTPPRHWSGDCQLVNILHYRTLSYTSKARRTSSSETASDCKENRSGRDRSRTGLCHWRRHDGPRHCPGRPVVRTPCDPDRSRREPAPCSCRRRLPAPCPPPTRDRCTVGPPAGHLHLRRPVTGPGRSPGHRSRPGVP